MPESQHQPERGWVREDTQERLCSPAWPARILNTGASDKSLPGPDDHDTTVPDITARDPNLRAPQHPETTP